MRWDDRSGEGEIVIVGIGASEETCLGPGTGGGWPWKTALNDVLGET